MKRKAKQVEAADERCPNCGYCPHCGQSQQARQWVSPYTQRYLSWGTYSSPTITVPATSGTMGTTTTYQSGAFSFTSALRA